ncbi:A-kinase anchor protein 200 isoform X2 [Contarinia nasturtii]|uniref:A-kinase anchor protein 200 isoform X2 n=1 Tax=Contarinia nasturtii TaxID=265458 RepID=UPI0012D3AAAE|nr:A-kinase anchor protein 200 isoform X2 [Contarinia nasturtii]
MGKAQSKRSVDITTENKEGVALAEGESGKVGKIEDVDQKPQLNGEANKDADSGTNEKQEEKKDDGAENEKDAATEKTEQPAAAEPAAAKTDADGQEAEKPAENGAGEEAENAADTTTGTLDESKDGVENAGDDANASSTPVTDSAKKPKKDKSKKRFLSFRSFSFSKKDKTKPKKEEAAANTTNGECEKVPEEGTEDAAAAADAVTNGTTEEVKTNGEQAAPVATPEESVTPPSNGDSKPIVEVAKETVDEVIVAASKSVDEKLNSVAKPEVNKNADQDLQETHTQALDNVEHEKSLSSENENVDIVQKNIVDTIDTSSVVGVVDCTNNSSNNDNDNINSQSAPPLPDSPPPSQITVFAESAMSVDLNQVENVPQTVLSVVETIVEPIAQIDSELVGDDKKIKLATSSELVAPSNDVKVSDNNNDVAVESQTIEVTEAKNEIIGEAPIETIEVYDEKLPTSNVPCESPQCETEIKVDNECEPELPKSDDEIAETIEILDRVNLNESDVIPIENVVTETNIEPISADISSPLQQYSLDTLPSPQSLSSSNLTPPNEIDESATVELGNEDVTSLPPPPPIDDIVVDDDEKTTEQSGSDSTNMGVDNIAENNSSHTLPPPPTHELIEHEIIDELKTNGVAAVSSVAVDNQAENDQKHNVDEMSGDGILNGSAKEHDVATNNISDKANGVSTDNGVSEKLNGDHKTEEIATSPEKLEKLAAANPPPSTEVVAAE